MIVLGHITTHGMNMIMTEGPRRRGETRRERIAVAIPRFQAHLF